MHVSHVLGICIHKMVCITLGCQPARDHHVVLLMSAYFTIYFLLKATFSCDILDFDKRNYIVLCFYSYINEVEENIML